MDLPGRPEIPKTATRPAEGETGADEGALAPKNRSMGLLEMLDWPEEEWRAQKVIGKEITQGLSPDMLRRALTMSTGPIPGVLPTSSAVALICGLYILQPYIYTFFFFS